MIFDGLIVHLRRVRPALGHVEPTVHRGHHEQRQHRPTYVIEIEDGVDPQSLAGGSVWADERPDALVEVGRRGVGASPKLSREELHAEYAEHHELEQAEERDVTDLRQRLDERGHDESHAA